MSMLVTACSVRAGQATPPVIPATAHSSEAITRTPDLGNQIRGMKVQLVARDSHPTVQLADGTYRSTNDTASPDYADVTLLAEPTALGDLNGDGIADAAALLAENYGGTGTFVSLLAILDVGGQPVQAGAYLIDDRPKIGSMRIDNGQITLGSEIHGPNDPGCCASLPVTDTLA